MHVEEGGLLVPDGAKEATNIVKELPVEGPALQVVEGGAGAPEVPEVPDAAVVDQNVEDLRVAQLKLDIERFMDDKDLQRYAQAIMMGNQLYAWAQAYIFIEFPKVSEDVKKFVLMSIKQSMLGADGRPRPFDEHAMMNNLDALQPFIKNKVKNHVKARKEHEAAVKKAVDNITVDIGKEEPKKEI